MAASERGGLLTTFAVLFAILAVSNMLKPLQLFGDQTAFVFLGARMTGIANTVLGPLFGVFLLAYAYGIWNMRRFAMPMGHAYASYVILNLVLWWLRGNISGGDEAIFTAVYAIVAIGVSLGSAITLTQRKAELS